MQKIFLAFLLLICAASLWAKPLPLEKFASLPDVSNLTLSPDGKKLSSIIRVDTENAKGVAVEVTDLVSSERNFWIFIVVR